MRNLEHRLQTACVGWFRLQYPNRLLFAIPNGGWRTPTTGAILKAEGATAGVPDLLLAEANKEYHGLFIEMKNGKEGRVSEAQAKMIEALRVRGYRCEIVRDVESFIKVVSEYLKN